MVIYPAIDLLDGACVRLAQGRFESATAYGDPFAQIAAFANAGAAWVHIVDLDGARSGRPVQHALIGDLARDARVRVQCGGGVRTFENAKALLDAGATRVVVGSTAARDPTAVQRWIAALGIERVCCAFDVRARDGEYEVVTHGWAEGSAMTLPAVLACYPVGALKHVLVTDVSRDGMLGGPNLALLEGVVGARADLAVQASGGVAAIEDIAAVRRIGAAGVIVGKALYERRFSLERALAC
ncbi:MAG: 1-(5-phosphoribosyl)-5-[(5-phosphoribosylamino)methylideneamino] imidazole-4-carboxamide isomerase [Hyphomonadaceae bacterium]|nr:1-(5-phosphoribosyl)-5-[(5-phosphoribosylamino)methylideneamino] imidazole-4-carboxamide isomerase [Hyphomonadaceae bacterium]